MAQALLRLYRHNPAVRRPAALSSGSSSVWNPLMLPETSLICPRTSTTTRLYSSTPLSLRFVEKKGDAEPVRETVKSQNQLFREIPVDPRVLARIRRLELGLKPSRRKAQKLERLIANVDLRLDRKGARQRRQRREAAAQGEGGGETAETISTDDKTGREISLTPPAPFGNQKETPGRFPVRIAGLVANPDRPIIPKYLDKVPQHLIPQVALCGRSNVGKSSLLNVLLYSDLATEAAEQARAEAKRQKLAVWASRATNKAEAAKLKKKARPRRRQPNTFLYPRGIKAVTSATPGETRHICFYQLGSAANDDDEGKKKEDLRLLLVDLPGYGFAHASPDEHARYQQLMVRYLAGTLPGQVRSALQRVLFLVDARHGMKKADFDFWDMVQRALVTQAHQQDREARAELRTVLGGSEKEQRELKQASRHANVKPLELPPIQIVLTKCDLVEPLDLCRRVTQVQQQLSQALLRQPTAAPLPVMLTSARRNQGILEVQRQVAALATSVPTPEPKKKKKKKKKKRQPRTAEEAEAADADVAARLPPPPADAPKASLQLHVVEPLWKQIRHSIHRAQARKWQAANTAKKQRRKAKARVRLAKATARAKATPQPWQRGTWQRGKFQRRSHKQRQGFLAKQQTKLADD